MEEEKKARLERRGWRVGTLKEFLGLDADETAQIDQRLTENEADCTDSADQGKRPESD